MRSTGWKRLAVGLLVVATVWAGTAQPAGALGSFNDDDATDHEIFIEVLKLRNITVGCNAEGTNYCPGDSVTRAQMASFIIRALIGGGAALPPVVPDAFTDDNGNVHEPSINLIAALGISLGDGLGHFRPQDAITRGEMALFIRRGFQFPQASGNRFTDVSGEYVEPANAMANAAVTLGCNLEGTLYCPDAEVQRGQMASFLVKALASPLTQLPLTNPVQLPIEIPGFPPLTELPTVPGLPPLPTVPGLPLVVPTVPGLPTLPGVPGLP